MVYSSPGVGLLKPNIPLPAIIIISILIGTEVLAIIVLVLYIRRGPTFTTCLDAFVVAAIGAQLCGGGVELADPREPLKELYEKLQKHDGMIGLNHGGRGEGGLTDAEAGRTPPSSRVKDMVPAAGDDSQGPRTILIGGICWKALPSTTNTRD